MNTERIRELTREIDTAQANLDALKEQLRQECGGKATADASTEWAIAGAPKVTATYLFGLREDAPKKAQILALLSTDGPMTARDIASFIDRDVRQVASDLSRYETEDLVAVDRDVRPQLYSVTNGGKAYTWRWTRED